MFDNNARGTLINQVGAVFATVADQDRALRFYLDTLGFEKRADFTYGEDSRWMEVAPPAAANTIALVPLTEDALPGNG
jgi:catechol 2,3-dioxygenase-like lactoylglutathione lyase family enzyme